ncbi:AraC family transcriptional regulator [Streptomyces sp. NPDC001523]|uniref:AraC family transcriptional regulator n=1 Tax=Streptomyces sp. NPDC001523 TaxID=3154383 RepID=UPI003316D0BE
MSLSPLDELRSLLARHARPDTTTALADVLISRVEEPAEPSASMTGTVMALIAQGSKHLALGDHVYEYGSGQYLVASIDLPVTGHFVDVGPDRPALGFGLTLRSSDIAELLLAAPPGAVPRRSDPRPGLAVSDASPPLLDAVVRLLRLLDHPRDADVLAPLVKREILWRLITGEQGATVRQLGLADSNLAHIARAVKWIRDHHTASFRVEDVARLVGMSESAFYRNFQAVTAMSPIRFQKLIRLQKARLLLAAHPRDVTSVGHQVGYDSPSQFSREYRRLFGAPPSRDAARLHGLVGGEPLP